MNDTMVKNRKSQSARNIIFALVNFLIKMLALLIVRMLLIKHLGEMYAGINSLFTNVLTVLSLAEMGFGAALVFSMYKPMAEGDTEKLKALTNLYKKIYFFVGLIVLVLGAVILPLLPHLISDYSSIPGDISVYIVFLLFLAQSAVSYFMAHRRALIFANQRNDIELLVNTLANLLCSGLQIAVLVTSANYYLYLIIYVGTTVLENLILFFISHKKFPEIDNKNIVPLNAEEKKQLKKNVLAMFFHRAGGVLSSGIDSLIISITIGVIVLGRYSNYLTITGYITSVIGILLNAVKGSIGNLIATSDKEYSYTIFKRLNFLFIWFVGFCAICYFVLIQPFITIWLGGDKLLTFEIIMLMTFAFYFTNSRKMTDLFKEVTGLFWNDRLKPLVEIIVKLAVAVSLCLLFGLAGVIIGTIVSTLLVIIWVEPLILYRNYFKKPLWKYFSLVIPYFIVTVFIGAVTWFALSFLPSGGILWFGIRMIAAVILPNILYLLFFFKTKELKFWIAELKSGLVKLFKQKFNRKPIVKDDSVA